MFILNSGQIPQSTAELITALTDFLRSWIQLPTTANPVTLAGELPALSSMTIDVSQGQISAKKAPPLSKVTQDLQPGPTAELFSLIGHPVSIADIPLQLDLTAKQAVFAYGRSTNQQLIAALQEAVNGHLSLQISHADLELAALNTTRHFAGNNVTIQKLEISLTPLSPTQLNVLINITAKKFVSAIIRVSGLINIDNQLVATATNLKAQAEGMVGTIAANMIQPHLKNLEGQPLPLMTFSLGNVKIRDVKIDTSNGLRISAAFGSEPA